MFETTTLSYSSPTKRVWTTAMGFTGQALLIACALLAPLISPQTLGRAFLVTTIAPPGAPPPPPPPGFKVVPQSHHAAATRVFTSNSRITKLLIGCPPGCYGHAVCSGWAGSNHDHPCPTRSGR